MTHPRRKSFQIGQVVFNRVTCEHGRVVRTFQGDGPASYVVSVAPDKWESSREALWSTAEMETLTELARETRSPEKGKRSPFQINDPFNRGAVEFLMIELDIGLNFADSPPGDTHEKRVRNHHHAQKVYETVLHMRDRFIFTTDEMKRLEYKLHRLKLLLENAGEEASSSTGTSSGDVCEL
jgi:hypothetical protein